MPIQLTANACARLRDATDDAIRTAKPVVRILFIRDGAGVGKEALVLDGQGFAWVALDGSAAALVGNGNGQLRAGTPVQLNRIPDRLQGNPTIVRVTCAEVMYTEADDDLDTMPLNVTNVASGMQVDDMVLRTRQLEFCLQLVAAALLPQMLQMLDGMNAFVAGVAAG